MNIYHVKWMKRVAGYDEYDEFVAYAESEDEVRCIHPNGFEFDTHDNGTGTWIKWSERDKLQVTLIGVASTEMKSGLILSSYCAGYT